jgi:hypothetical protein
MLGVSIFDHGTARRRSHRFKSTEFLTRCVSNRSAAEPFDRRTAISVASLASGEIQRCPLDFGWKGCGSRTVLKGEAASHFRRVARVLDADRRQERPMGLSPGTALRSTFLHLCRWFDVAAVASHACSMSIPDFGKTRRPRSRPDRRHRRARRRRLGRRYPSPHPSRRGSLRNGFVFSPLSAQL